jgi:HAD superfamily hydrolase (TIGR01490 family)
MENTFSGDRIIPPQYVTFFDLDQTLADSVSGKLLANCAFRKGLLKCSDLVNAVFLSFLFRFKLKDPLKIIDDMVGWVKGIPENSLLELCSEVTGKLIIPSVYPEARAEIAYHKSKKAKVVILSSALKSVCEIIAENLNIDDIICSELEIKNGYLTGRPLGHICFGEEKAVRLLEYCEKNNFSTSDAWYYGDSIHDFPALNSVGNQVCVNPDKKLKKAAIKRNWRVKNWKN